MDARRAALVTAYLATVPAANWFVGHVGWCPPGWYAGPCLIPVWPGLWAPSGLAFAALALVLRDLVQASCGLAASLLAVVVGCVLSLEVAPPELAAASALAFLLSEVLDAAVYTPLRRRGLVTAVLASGMVGCAVDSAAFLFAAFGDLDHLTGQLVGKWWALAAAVLVLRATRRSVLPSLGVQP